jgi:hypothetical protein
MRNSECGMKPQNNRTSESRELKAAQCTNIRSAETPKFRNYEL